MRSTSTRGLVSVMLLAVFIATSASPGFALRMAGLEENAAHDRVAQRLLKAANADPQAVLPMTAGLEETNLRKAIGLGSIFCFDFFQNISDALIDAAIADGATEFTMNPYSTGNYIQHLLTLSTDEGRQWAQQLLQVQTAEQWVDFKKRLGSASAKVQTAIKAAMEPSPGVTPETELDLAKEVAKSMAAEAKIVSGMVERLTQEGKSDEEAYWAITKYLTAKIAGRLSRIFQESKGRTGYVSIEVDPRIERPEFAQPRAGGTEIQTWMIQQMQKEAEDLKGIAANILVKAPATKAGISTIRQVNANFNTTLAFADDDAREAIAAYEARQDLAHLLRVSPFVSRNAVYFEEFWGDLLKEADGHQEMDGHVATIANTYDTYKAMGPYADGAIWSSLGMKVKGDPGWLYAWLVVGVGILNAPPETARDFNRAQFEIRKLFGEETLEQILTRYFQFVKDGKIPSAAAKFPGVMNGSVTPQQQAHLAAAKWQVLKDQRVDEARLERVVGRIGELEQAAKKPIGSRRFTREAVEKARVLVKAGQWVTEKDMMRLVLKAEGEEKFIDPFQGAIDALRKEMEQLRRKHQESGVAQLNELSQQITHEWLAAGMLPKIEDLTGTFHPADALWNDPRRQITPAQAGQFFKENPNAVLQAGAEPNSFYLVKLGANPGDAYLSVQREVFQARLADLRQRKTGLEENPGLEESWESRPSFEIGRNPQSNNRFSIRGFNTAGDILTVTKLSPRQRGSSNYTFGFGVVNPAGGKVPENVYILRGKPLEGFLLKILGADALSRIWLQEEGRLHVRNPETLQLLRSPAIQEALARRKKAELAKKKEGKLGGDLPLTFRPGEHYAVFFDTSGDNPTKWHLFGEMEVSTTSQTAQVAISGLKGIQVEVGVSPSETKTVSAGLEEMDGEIAISAVLTHLKDHRFDSLVYRSTDGNWVRLEVGAGKELSYYNGRKRALLHEMKDTVRTAVQLTAKQPGNVGEKVVLRFEGADNRTLRILPAIAAAGLEEQPQEVVEARAAVSAAEMQAAAADRAGDESLTSIAQLDQIAAGNRLNRALNPAPVLLKDSGSILVEDSGLEEARSASVVVLSFDPAAGLPLLRSGIRAFVVVPTLTDARHQIELGVEPEQLIGVLWAGLEEQDYLSVNSRIRNFVTADLAVSGWQQEVVRFASSQMGAQHIVPIYGADSLATGLEELGVPGTTVSRILQLRSDAEATLEQMK